MARKKRPALEVIDFAKLPRPERAIPIIKPGLDGYVRCAHCHNIVNGIMANLPWLGTFQTIECSCGFKNRVFY